MDGVSPWAPCPQPSGGWWSRLSELNSGGGSKRSSPSGGLTLIPFRSGATLRSFKTTQISEAGFELENTDSIYFFIFWRSYFRWDFDALTVCVTGTVSGMCLFLLQGLSRTQPAQHGVKMCQLMSICCGCDVKQYLPFPYVKKLKDKGINR